jgi:hypothetical protein
MCDNVHKIIIIDVITYTYRILSTCHDMHQLIFVHNSTFSTAHAIISRDSCTHRTQQMQVLCFNQLPVGNNKRVIVEFWIIKHRSVHAETPFPKTNIAKNSPPLNFLCTNLPAKFFTPPWLLQVYRKQTYVSILY